MFLCICKKYRHRSDCAGCAGWPVSILFAFRIFRRSCMCYFLVLIQNELRVIKILLLVKSMPVFIRRASVAIFPCTFMNTLFTSAATATRTLMTLSLTIEFNLKVLVLYMSKDNANSISIQLLHTIDFCGICRRRCHYEFNTVFWKSCIEFCAKPNEVDPIKLISLRQISVSTALKYIIKNNVWK